MLEKSLAASRVWGRSRSRLRIAGCISHAGPGKPEKRQSADADDARIARLWRARAARESSAGPGKPEKRQPADADDARLGGPWQLAKAARDLGSLKQDNRLMLMMLALAGPGSSKAAWDLGSLKKDNRLMLMMLALAGPGSSRKPRGTWPEKDNRLMLMMLALAGPGSSRKQRGTWEA